MAVVWLPLQVWLLHILRGLCALKSEGRGQNQVFSKECGPCPIPLPWFQCPWSYYSPYFGYGIENWWHDWLKPHHLANFFVLFSSKLWTVICDHLFRDAITSEVSFCAPYDSLTGCIIYCIQFPKITVIVYCDEICLPANVNRSCAIIDYGAVGTSGDIKGSFCCLAAYLLQIEHWLTKWRISFVMAGQNMTSLARIAFGTTTFVPFKTMFLSTTSSCVWIQASLGV